MANTTEPKNGEKILIAYYSLSGNTARVARDLAALTGADIESIRDREHGVGFVGYIKAMIDALRGVPARIGPLAKNPATYTTIIIGTPVWVGRMTPAVRAYLQATQGTLRNVAFFVTSGNTDVGKVLPALEQAAKIKAVAAAGFNARELKDQAVYDARMATFVNALRRRPVPPERPIGEHAPVA